VVEEMLRHYVSPTCSDWDEHLSCAEFAINNSWHETVHNTPFIINYGQSPITPVLLELPSNPAPRAQDFAETWQSLVRRGRAFMEQAQERYARHANAHRRHVQYTPGQLVLLSTRNLKLKGGVESRKLLPKFIGPFTVKKLVGSSEQKVAAELDLPERETWLHREERENWEERRRSSHQNPDTRQTNMKRLHPVFHVSLLKPYTQSPGTLHRVSDL
jgi:hypothetical protein